MNTDKPSREQEFPYRPLALSIAVVAGFIATILRIVPHPTNMTSVGAVGLFGGARVRAWHAYLLPLGVMVVSDLILWALTGFDFKYSLAHPSRAYVYASFMIYVLIGRWLHNRNSIVSVTIAATVGGLQFFVLTNFCEWLFQPLAFVEEQYRYSRDLNGLLMCFTAALPFYQGETPFSAHPFVVLTDFRLTIVWNVIGDIFFTTAYLLVYAKLAQRISPTEKTPMPATNG
jgi:hypothetical protein